MAQVDLLPEQKKAIASAVHHRFSLLTGGPGTGKTHTVGMLLKCLWDALDPQERNEFQIAVAAPTGKAAAQLQSSLCRALKGTGWEEKITASTLHGLLGVRLHGAQDLKPQRREKLLIIDEGSMIDAKLMMLLFESIGPETHLLLVGDAHQLPPVESGALFGDLAAVGLHRTWHTHLSHCMRSELKGLVTLAEAVKEGDGSAALQAASESSVQFVERTFTSKDLEALYHECSSFYTRSIDPVTALEQQKEFRLLSPLKRGLFGTESLNQYFEERIQHSWRPIIITGNAPELELFNGELGVLVEGKEALFFDRKGQMRRIPEILLPRYALAYCLSVHKSQGSEFQQVLLLLPPRSEYFGRPIVYTGVTRSRCGIQIWGCRDRFLKTIENHPKRISGVQYQLEKALQRNALQCEALQREAKA